MRDTDAEPHPKEIQRQEEALAAKRLSRRQLVVTVAIAVIGSYKLTLGRAEGTSELLWVATMLVAGAIASVSDFRKAFGE